MRELALALKVAVGRGGLAAFLEHRLGVIDGVIALLLPGGNISPAVFADCVTAAGGPAAAPPVVSEGLRCAPRSAGGITVAHGASRRPARPGAG